MRKVFSIFIIFLFLLNCSSSVHKKATSTLDPPGIPIIPLPWSDNFERNDLGDWQVFLDTPTNETTWEVEQGLLVQESDLAIKTPNDESFRGTHIVAGSPRWQNYSFLAWLKNLDDDGVGLIFRYRNPQNYYRFFFIKDQQYEGPFFRLEKYQNGVFKILQKSPWENNLQANETAFVGIELRQDTIRAFYQDQLIFEVRDSTNVRGQIGFSTFANKGLFIDSVYVTSERFRAIKDRNFFKPIQVRLDHAVGYYSYAIRGMVFNDFNGNGIQDGGEKGIPGIPVSDGKEIVLTDSYGIYALTNTEKEAQLVFISIPANFRKNSRFYYLLHDSLGQQTFSFPLRYREKPDQLPLHFIQITDIHVQDSSSASHFEQCLAKLDSQDPKAEFIIATGDLVETGSVVTEFAAYSKAIKKNNLPIYSVIGNHDLDTGLNRLDHFHEFLGPDYYSFDLANWHFIILNSIVESNKQKLWFEKDLQLCAVGKSVLIFQHYPPTQNQVEILCHKNVKAFFTGHWHSNKIFRHEGLYSYNTPPFRFGGIDNSPAGYRMITLEADSIYTQFRYLTPQKHFEIASPAPGSIYSHRNLHIVLNVLNYEEKIVRVSYNLARPNSFNEFGELSPKGEFSWAKLINESLFNDEFHLTLILLTASNQQIKLESTFMVKLAPEIELTATDDCRMFKKETNRNAYWPTPLKPPLGLKWVGFTQGSIDFASPIVVNDLVAIASKDRHNLNTNNICVFDAATGDFKWCFETEAAIHHSLVATADEIIGQDVTGTIYMLDQKSGEAIWQQTIFEKPAEYWLYATPIVENQRIFAGNAASLAILQSTDGTLLLKKRMGAHWISTYASPTLYFDKLLIGSMWHNKNLYCLQSETGERSWELAIAGTHAAPMIYQDRGFISTFTGKLVSFNPGNGETFWQQNLGDGWAPTTPSASDSIVVVGSGDGKMLGIDMISGKIRWQFSCHESIFPISPYRTRLQALTSSPVITGNFVYFGATDGYLYALDLHTGKLCWEYKLGFPILSTPAVAGKALYLGAFDGNVYCFVAIN